MQQGPQALQGLRALREVPVQLDLKVLQAHLVQLVLKVVLEVRVQLDQLVRQV